MKNNDRKSTAVSRAIDMMTASEYAVSTTGFCSPGEIAEIYAEIRGTFGANIERCFFWGGCRGADRRVAVFLPEWCAPGDAPHHSLPQDCARCDFFASYLTEHPEITAEIPITALKITGSRFSELSHRDYMGAILALGFDRSVIGDIALTSSSEAVAFVSDKVAPYICSELKKIGRDGVSTQIEPISPMWEIPRKFAPVPIIVSSPRLDGVVKALTNQSRENSAAMVRAGLVDLSYFTTDDVSAQVKEGDILSIRGYGKFAIGAVVGETKSGRIKIECKKYL